MKIYFSDFFEIDSDTLNEYGALNISLINDLPLFIDPFLLIDGNKPEYKIANEGIIKYLTFLKRKSEEIEINDTDIKSWYVFKEVKQNWLGFSKAGNDGAGLGIVFGRNMSSSMSIVFDDLGKETIHKSTHLEKATLFNIGVGRDGISDFTTNLILEYLLNYTQEFAVKHLEPAQTKEVMVNKAYFDYNRESWRPKKYTLPYMFGDYIILTPKDLLTKDETWINNNDLRNKFHDICSSIDNGILRSQISSFYSKALPIREEGKDNSKKEKDVAVRETIKKFPELIKWYLKEKEESGIRAKKTSIGKVSEVETAFIENLRSFASKLSDNSTFYEFEPVENYERSKERVFALKDYLENIGSENVFYPKGEAIKREEDLQLIQRLIWFAAEGYSDRIEKLKSDFNINFKLASNNSIKKGIEKHLSIESSEKDKNILVIFYYNHSDHLTVLGYLDDLELSESPNIILINASVNNKSQSDLISNETIKFDYSQQDWYINPLPKEKNVSYAAAKEKFIPKLAIITAVEVELEAVLKRLKPPKKNKSIWRITQGDHVYYLGRFGAIDAVVCMSGMGSTGIYGSQVTVDQLIRDWNPTTLIMVGIAFGADISKHKVGDVLITNTIVPYESQRVDENPSYRSSRPPASADLLNRMRNTLQWNFKRPDGVKVSRHYGNILTGDKLVDDISFKLDLLKIHSQIIGGEMEGSGLYVSATRHKKSWSLVKSVCDWGDGEKHKEYQKLAAASSVSFCEFIFDNPYVLDGL